MAEKSPAYQRYPKDYLGDENVVVMTLEEEGAYNRLMDFCWMQGSLPSDMRELAAMCKNVPVKRMQKMWERIGRCFQPHPDHPGRLTHKRLDKEREKQAEWSRKSSEGGKKGSATRWGKDKGGHALVNESLQDGSNQSMTLQFASSSASASALNDTDTTTATRGVAEDVENFVSLVIRTANGGMSEALPDFQPILTSHASRQSVHDWVIAGIDRQMILDTVAARAKGATRQISSMKYFDKAIREAQEKAQAVIHPDSQAGQIKADGPSAEKPKDERSKRSGKLKHAGTDEDIMARDAEDAKRVAEWDRLNEARAVEIWNEIRDEQKAAGADALGQTHFKRAIDALYRRRILAEFLTPKLAAS